MSRWRCPSCSAWRKGPTSGEPEPPGSNPGFTQMRAVQYPPCARCGSTSVPDDDWDDSTTYAEDPLGGAW